MRPLREPHGPLQSGNFPGLLHGYALPPRRTHCADDNSCDHKHPEHLDGGLRGSPEPWADESFGGRLVYAGSAIINAGHHAAQLVAGVLPAVQDAEHLVHGPGPAGKAGEAREDRDLEAVPGGQHETPGGHPNLPLCEGGLMNTCDV